MPQPKMTRHARQRLQQRGARPKEIDIVMTYGDIGYPQPEMAADFCGFLAEPRRGFCNPGRVAIQDVDRATRLLVLADPSDRVVTVFKCGTPNRRLPGSKRGWGRR